MLSDLRFRLRAFFHRDVVEAELDDELQFHLEHEIEKYMRSGMTREEAARRARLSFGGISQVQEDCREARGTMLLHTASQDIGYAFRGFRKDPGFSVLAILTLALGIGASTAVFSLVNTILFKPLPYPNANRLVMVWRAGPIQSFPGIDSFAWAPQELPALKQQTPNTFQNLGIFKKESFNLTGAGTPQLLEGVRVSAGFFPALGVQPVMGRSFLQPEDQPGHDRVVVLSNRLWNARFGGDPHVVGSTIDLNGVPYSVIGIMPPSFTFPNVEGMPPTIDLPKETQLWLPLALPAGARGSSDYGVVGELQDGVTFSELRQALTLVDRHIEDEAPGEKGYRSTALPFISQLVADARRPLLLLLGAVGFVLLIACSNVAGLMLNRSLRRRKEFTLRAALGAGRARLVRQLMTESLLLAFAGGLLGVVVGQAALFSLKHFGPRNIPHLQEVALDVRVLAFAVVLALITGILFGLAPASGATRVNLVDALKEGTQRSGGSTAAPRIRNALLVSQVALAFVLVVAAGLLVRTFYDMLRADAGFDVTRVVTFELPLPKPKYDDTGRMAQIYEQVLQRIQSISAVKSAGFASVVPMGGAPDGTVIRIPEHPTPGNAPKPYANYLFISPGYLATIGAPLQHGRDIADTDTLTTLPVTIINSSMAKTYWPNEDPIGKQVGVGSTRYPVRTVIGVVPDIKQASLREKPTPTMFVPYSQNEIKVWPSMQSMQYAVRTKADPTLIASSLRDAVQSVDPDLPVANFATLSTLVDTSMAADRFSMLLLSAFGSIALLLASIGMYGVISYSVIQRTPEIGIRVALGAQRTEIFAMVVKQGLRFAGLGIGMGLIAAFTTTRLMIRFLYGVEPTDPATFIAVSLLLVAIAVIASCVPARRATRVDPMIALRYE